MDKTEEIELKADFPENTSGTDLLRLFVKVKLGTQDGGGGRGSENGVDKELLQNKGNHQGIEKEVGSDENPQVCVVCRKTFPSLKSLYGHMRMHPDRGWRGVKPLNAEVKPEGVFDPPQLVVPVWSVTGKRGRGSSDSVASCLYPGSSTQGIAEEGKRGDEDGNLTVTEVQSDNLTEKILPDDPIGGEEARDKNSCVGKEVDKKPKRKAKELDGTDQGPRAKKASGDTSGSGAADNHTCSKCHKSFPSFQALGGHMSSCGKPKKRAMANEATNANMPVICSSPPSLDLSLSLLPFTPCSSTSVAVSDIKNEFHPSTEETPDNEPNMIKFL